MATKNDIPELLRQGIELARQGKKAEARALFEQVTELDENNEKGWFWLASVVDSDEERRICFSNVLHINPNNEKAQRAMASLEEKLSSKRRPAEDEVIAGIPRRQFTLIVGAGIGLVVLIVLVGLVVIVGNNNRIASESATATAIAQISTQNKITEETAQAVATAAAVALAGTQTALVPTPVPVTPTSNIPTLPPTWTPTPSQTPIVTPTALPAPLGLLGRLVVWGGVDELNTGYLPVGYYNLDFGNQYNRIGSELGAHISIAANGQRVVYERYDELLFSTDLQAININGTEETNLVDFYRAAGLTIVQPKQPNIDSTGQKVTFVAKTDRRNSFQVFVVDLTPGLEDATRARQLTDDDSDYSYPAFSPDGTRVAAVRADLNSAAPGVDLVNISASDGGRFLVTNDLTTLIETTPRWSSDGLQIIYAAAPATDPTNNDIFARASSGSGSTLPIYRNPADDLFPVFSKDSRHMAFASNRTGPYEVFIYDTVTQSVAQLTTGAGDDFPGGWWQP